MATSKTAASRVEAVTKKLREGIFQGRYPPGTPLRELTVAKQLKVSQTTVREALRRLEHAGLVRREENRGSTVTRLTPQQVRERVILRASLEASAACAAAGRMSEANFAELEHRLRVLESAVASDRYYEAAQADLDFHRYVWECSGNSTICSVLELITVPLFAFISILRRQGLQRLNTVVEAHEPLIVALRSGDLEQVKVAFENGATHSYHPLLEQPGELALAGAFGLLELDHKGGRSVSDRRNAATRR